MLWISSLMRDHDAKAFTLTELLVVIAIIGVLAALLLPVLTNTKELGRLARCQANLRQLSLAMEMYVSDNGHYPYYLMVGSSPTNFLSWDGALLPYTQNQWTGPLYRCPSYRYPTRSMSYDAATHAWIAPQGSYGYNWIGTGELPSTSGASILHLGLGAIAVPSGGRVESARKDSEVLVPADMAELGDGGGGQISPPSAVAPSYQRFAHRKLLNVTFCDGHVETLQGFRFYEATPETRRRFNYDHEPHPETWEEVLNGNVPSGPQAPRPVPPASAPAPPPAEHDDHDSRERGRD
jgi:prepilin-type N-terminal cleavage/methylation domain-containing protein/prepilin-type processing-associated H-X9-DG protein